MKKIIIIGILGILVLTSCISLSAEINTSTTFIENTQDDIYEDFDCFIIGRVTRDITFFDKYNNERWIWDALPIAFTTNSKIAFGLFIKNNLWGGEYEYPAKGWLKIKGSNGSYLWNKNSFKGTIETIYIDEIRWELYYYIGVTEFTGYKIGGVWSSETFIIGYASHVKLGPYSPW